MIYTLTINPSIDYVIHKDIEKLPKQLRFTDEEHVFTFGGKGINASYVLKELGTYSKAIAPASGPFGNYFSKILEEIELDFIRINSDFDMRINVKVNLVEDTYEFNGPSRKLSGLAKAEIISIVEKLSGDDILMIMGTVNINDINFIEQISQIVRTESWWIKIDS